MHKRLLPAGVTLLLLGLGACGRGTPTPAAFDAVPPSPFVAVCREEARRGPEMRSQARESNVDNPANILRLAEERADIEDRAFRDCLRRRGAPQPGGVERIRR